MTDIQQKTKKVKCPYPCSGKGYWLGTYGLVTCEVCNGKGYTHVKYHKPGKYWVKIKNHE